MKLNKIYRLMIQLPYPNSTEYLEITPPLTLEFNISRHTQASANSANLKIYNLSEKTRSLIFRDRYQDFWDINSEMGPLNYPANVQLFAGYENEGKALSLIFNGQIFNAHSTRMGPNYITELDCQDIAINQYAQASSTTLNKSASQLDVLLTLFRNLNAANAGFLSTGMAGAATGRGRVLFGPTYELLKQYTNNNVFVDNGKLIAILDDEAFDNPAFPYLSKEEGLLNVPIKSNAQIIAQTAFTPQAIVGQKLTVNGYQNTEYNGTYKVIGLTHAGIISETHDGPTITSLSLYSGSMLKTPVRYEPKNGAGQ